MTILATGNQGNYSSVTTATSHVLTFGFTPTAGNLLVVVCGSNQVIVVPSGWTAGAFVDNQREARIFWKISDGTETSVTISVTTGSWDLIATVREYSGIDQYLTAIDRTATATGTSATVPTGTTAVTSRTEELCIGCWVGAGSGSYSGYTNGFTEFVDGVTSAAAGVPTTLAAAELITSTASTKTSTATGSSSFAYSACIATFFGADRDPITPTFVCGAECGIAVVGTASAGTEHWSSVTPTPTVVTSGPSPMRSTRCFRFNPSAAQSTLTHGFASAIASPASCVLRFYVYFASLPTADARLMVVGAANALGVMFKQSDSKLYACGASTALLGASGVSVTTGTWYRIDVRAVYDTTRTADVRIDGVAAGQYSLGGQVAATANGFTIGVGNSATADLYVDDIIVSGTAADFPIGEGTVAGLYPNGDKTNSVASGTGNNGHIWSATTDFAKGTSGATATGAQNVESTSWQSLDNPLTTTAAGSWIADLLGISTEQICWTYTPLPAASAVNGVMQVATTHSASTTANAITIGLAATAVSNGYAVVNSDLSETTITVPVAIVANDFGAAWTPAALDGTKSWFYFSASDVNPDPYLDGVCLEVDYVPQLGRYPHRDVRQAINRGSFY